MTDARRELIYRALVALNCEAESANAEPGRPCLGVAFCLSFLNAVSDGRSRRSYVRFWKDMTAVDTSNWADEHKAYKRRTQLAGGMNAIIRSLGLPTTPGVFSAIARGHRDGPIQAGHVEVFWNEVERFHMRGIPARKRPVRQ